MELPLYNMQGEQAGTIPANDRLLDADTNNDLVNQVALAQLSNQRQPLAHTKDRSEVRGGGKKPWRQKGTGRARHGSNRSPIWVGGGVTFGPRNERNFKKNINRTAARRALACVLTARQRDGHLLVVDNLELDGKTKGAVEALDTITAKFTDYLNRKDKKSRVLVVLPGTEADMPVRRALGNVPYADTMRAADLNALAVLSYPYIVLTKEALEVAEKTVIK